MSVQSFRAFHLYLQNDWSYSYEIFMVVVPIVYELVCTDSMLWG